jgi:hypothetical protein
MKPKQPVVKRGKSIDPVVPIDVIRPPHTEGGSAETELPVPKEPKEALIKKREPKIPDCDPPRD